MAMKMRLPMALVLAQLSGTTALDNGLGMLPPMG
jgi:hypothetical protein